MDAVIETKGEEIAVGGVDSGKADEHFRQAYLAPALLAPAWSK